MKKTHSPRRRPPQVRTSLLPLLLGVGALFAGCSPSDPVDLDPLPDYEMRDAVVFGGSGGGFAGAGGFGASGGAGGVAGGGGAGAAGGEGGAMAGGAGGEAGSGGGGGQIFIDESLNFNPLQLTTLADDDEGWLVWYDAEVEALYGRAVPAVVDFVQPDLAERETLIADLPPDQITQRLQGVHQRNRPWWVFVANGPNNGDADDPRLIQAINVESKETVTLDLIGDTYYDEGEDHPRIRVALDESTGYVLVVGRSTDDEDNITRRPPVAWQVLKPDGTLGDRVDDIGGLSFPESVVYGLGSFVFATGDGHCAVLDGNDQAPQISSGWRCEQRSGARLLVDGNDQLTFMGPLDGVTEGPRMWRAAPGQAVAPEGPTEEVTDRDGVVQLIDAELTTANWSPVQHLNPDAWLIFYRGPGLAEGEAGDPRFLLLEGNQARRLDMSALENPLGLLRRDNGNLLQAVTYDGADMELAPIDVTPDPERLAGAPANALERENPQPEDCSDADLDGDGNSRNGLCCLSSEAVAEPEFDARLTTTPDDGPTATVLIPGTETALIAIPTLDEEDIRAEAPFTMLMSYTRGADAPVQLGTWERAGRPRHLRIDASGTRLIAQADYEGEEVQGPAILWGQRSGDAWTLEARAYPCPASESLAETSVLDIAFVGESTVRFFCTGDYRDVDFDLYAEPPGESIRADNINTASYPEDAILNWITRRTITREEFGTREVALAATYDVDADENFYPLRAYNVDNGAFEAQVLDEVELMDAEVADADRFDPIVLPVEAGGPTIRRRGVNGEWLEVRQPGLGWLQMPGTRKVQASLIVPDQPLAYTLGFLEPIDGNIGNNKSIGLLSHNLAAGADFWGRTMPQDLERPLKGNEIHQIGFLPFTAGSDGPWVFRLRVDFREVEDEQGGSLVTVSRFDTFSTRCE